MANPTTAGSGDPSPPVGSSAKPSPPTGPPTASASSSATRRSPRRRRDVASRLVQAVGARKAPRARGSSGRRLFAFDRRSACRLVAGADEAGRGCLAGPLVAAGVLFDYERADHPRAARAERAERLQAAHRARRARSSTRSCCAAPRACRGRLALRARDRRARPAQDQPRRAARRDARRHRAASPGEVLCLRRRLLGARLRAPPARDRRRRRHQRRDRGGLDRRQGHPRPLHAPRRRASTRAGASPSTSATRRPCTARRSLARASRRCTGCPSSRSPTSSWRSSQRRSHHAPSMWSRRSRRSWRRRSRRSRRSGSCGRVGADVLLVAQPCGGQAPQARALAGRSQASGCWSGRDAPRRALARRVLTSANTSVRPSNAIRSISPWRVRTLRAER